MGSEENTVKQNDSRSGFDLSGETYADEASSLSLGCKLLAVRGMKFIPP